MQKNKENANLYTKTDCLLFQSENCACVCALGCEQCPLKNSGKYEQEEVIRDVELVRSLLPNGSLNELISSDKCQLCIGTPQKPTGYAVTDFGHPEPQGTKVSAIGIKVKTSVGSMVPVQIPCCDKCKKNHLIANYLPLTCIVAIVVIGLLIMAIPPVTKMLIDVSEIMPLLVFIILIPIGWISGYLISKSFVANAEKTTLFDIKKIDYISKMAKNGWFPITGSKKTDISLVFSKERLKRGWFV